MYVMRSRVVLGLLSLLPVSFWGQSSANTTKSPDGANKPDKYAAESVVHEHASSVYSYAADGTGYREIAVASRIQSEAAARQFGVVSIGFANDSERVEIQYVRARKPDGTVVETPATDAQEIPTEVSRLAPFYSDLREKQIPVRNLRVGDTVEYKARIVRTKAEAPGQFWGQETFGYGSTNQVVLDETIELRVPKNKYVNVWSPQHKPVITEENGETVYRWKDSQLEPSVKPDGKPNTKEVDPDGELPSVAWTTFKSWQEVGEWYRALESDRIIPDADVKAKVAELIAGKTTDEEKARALYSYVATQIRYIGVALGQGRYQPHTASDVLRNQYGDCKDKHTLLAAMLTAAGFHPEAVLIGAGIRLNEDVPSPSAFNHLITTLPVDGKQVWLDTTSEIAPYRMLIVGIRDKQALVVPESGVAKLERTPATPPFAPYSRWAGKGTLSKEGTIKAQIEYTTRGDDELVMRALLRQIPPGQWDLFIQRFSQGLGFAGTTSHTEVTRPDETNVPEKIAYDYEREKTGDWDNYKIYPLFPPVYLNGVDEKDPPKKFSIELGEPRVETSISTITLPDGWGTEPPKDIHQKAAFATFDETYKIDHNVLTVERRIEILQKRIPASDWKTYKKWLDATTISDGEPSIQLTTTGTKAEDKGPPPAGSNNPEAAKLVKEAYEDIQRGEINKAQGTLDAAQKINDKQAGLWSTYGYLHYQQQEWERAIEAYKKEIDLYPNTAWVYGAMAHAQINAGHFDEGLDTLRTLIKKNPDDDAPVKTLAALLTTSRQYDEAVTVLKPLAAKSPDDANLQIQLATAEINSGKAAEGTATVLAALKSATDPGVLNNGAYELADAGVELETAEQSARKAVELLTAQSDKWTVSDTSKSQMGTQQLLVASWDTLGWALFREGKVDEAEGYIRAAWINQPNSELGFHLGTIEEKKGHLSTALGLYDYAIGSRHSEVPKGIVAKGPDKIADELHDRIDSLMKKQTKPDRIDLQKMRTLPVGKFSGKNAFVEYTFALSEGKIAEVKKGDTLGSLPDAETMAKRVDMVKWLPPSSTARLLRKGILNCHGDTCEFVVYPL